MNHIVDDTILKLSQRLDTIQKNMAGKVESVDKFDLVKYMIAHPNSVTGSGKNWSLAYSDGTTIQLNDIFSGMKKMDGNLFNAILKAHTDYSKDQPQLKASLEKFNLFYKNIHTVFKQVVEHVSSVRSTPTSFEEAINSVDVSTISNLMPIDLFGAYFEHKDHSTAVKVLLTLKTITPDQLPILPKEVIGYINLNITELKTLLGTDAKLMNQTITAYLNANYPIDNTQVFIETYNKTPKIQLLVRIKDIISLEDVAKEMPLSKIIDSVTLMNKLCKYETNKAEIGAPVEFRQMLRIKDGRSSATKTTMMHLVTGQQIKHTMVEDTLKLCNLLYDSTHLDLKEAKTS